MCPKRVNFAQVAHDGPSVARLMEKKSVGLSSPRGCEMKSKAMKKSIIIPVLRGQSVEAQTLKNTFFALSFCYSH